MSIENKAGAGVPVAEVDENPRFTTAYPLLNNLLQETWWMARGPNNMDTGIAWYESLKSFLESIAAPPAVMPAAPSDAVTEILALVRSYGDARQDGSDNRAAGWIRDITAALQAPQANPAAGEQAGAVAGWQLVPVEPTQEMTAAAGNTPGMRAIDSASSMHQLRGNPLPADAFASGSPMHQAYRAMLAAAPGAAIAAREQAKPGAEDMVNAAYRLHKYRQGTDSGIAFNRGARWMRTALASREEAPATPPTAIPADLSTIAKADVLEVAKCIGLIGWISDCGSWFEFSDTQHPSKLLIEFAEHYAALTQPTTVQQAEPTDEQIIAAAYRHLSTWDQDTIGFARAVLALKGV